MRPCWICCTNDNTTVESTKWQNLKISLFKKNVTSVCPTSKTVSPAWNEGINALLGLNTIHKKKKKIIQISFCRVVNTTILLAMEWTQSQKTEGAKITVGGLQEVWECSHNHNRWLWNKSENNHSHWLTFRHTCHRLFTTREQSHAYTMMCSHTFYSKPENKHREGYSMAC